MTEDQITAAQRDTMLKAIERPQVGKEDQEFLAKENILIGKISGKVAKRKVDMLIGCDAFWSLMQPNFAIEKLPSGLFAIPTRFGYFISGPRKHSTETKNSTIHAIQCICKEAEQNDNTETQIETMLSIDSVGISEFHRSSEEEKKKTNDEVLKQFESSVKRIDGRYYVSFPWKDNLALLPTNKSIAWRRLTSVLDTYGHDEWIMQQYCTTFNGQLSKGIIELARDDPNIQSRCIHYLAHRPVITLNKDTTKCRIVFDASAHFKNCPSLNDMMHTGPTILPTIVGMLIRFRLGEIVLCSDIEKAFLQIKLNLEDRDATRFLWVKDPTKPPANGNIIEYRMTCVPFGTNSSPSLMGMTLAHHVQSTEDSNLATEILNNAYVDNIIVFATTVPEAVRKYEKLKEIFEDAQMNLRECSSNSQEVLEAITTQDKAENLNPKVLGIPWNSEKDLIKVQSIIRNKDQVTKRSITQQHASTYDPLGWMTPLLLKSKLFLQKLWQMELKWDIELPVDTAREWKKLKEEISGFEKSIPRKVNLDTSRAVKLIVFTDASQEAHATCAYIANSSGSELIMARSKLRQAKAKTTIPKMELHAAALGCRMLKTILAEVETMVKVETVILLTDSEIALSWIVQEEGKSELGTYVDRRRREIRQTATEIEDKYGLKTMFGYINTKINPADVATRGLSKSDLMNHLWWTGPIHISEDIEDWPEETRLQTLGNGNMQITCAAVKINTSKKLLNLERYHSWQKARRVYVYVRRYIEATLSRARQKIAGTTPQPIDLEKKHEIQPINAEEIRAASRTILYMHQIETGMAEDRTLLAKLAGFLDADGLWRSRGRIGKSSLNEEAKYPTIIAANSTLANLVVQAAHETVNKEKLHLATSHTMAEVRRSYWIPTLRTLARKIIRRCITCQRYNNLPFRYPEMTHLPEGRVTRTYTFAVTGLDYMGPIEYQTEDKSRKSKAYGCIFTCATIRLIHLEVVWDQTALGFVNAVRRFLGRRGTPKLIICDNAANFNLGEKILTDATKTELPSEELGNLLAEREIEWQHITPLSPWKGGFYERLVKSVKHSFYKATRSRKLNMDDLQTIFTEIEATLNTRPLTYVESDEGKIIRPIDFVQKDIILSPTLGNIEAEQDDETYLPPSEAVALKTRLETEKALMTSIVIVNKFWDIWREEYLTNLREFHHYLWKQGNTTSISPEIGMVVLVAQERMPRNAWKLGRITEKRSLREVTVKMPNGNNLVKSINHLIPLEISNSDATVNGDPETNTRETTTEEVVASRRNRPIRKPRVDYSRFL